MTRSGQPPRSSFVAAPQPRIFNHGEATYLLGRDGVARQVSGDSAALVDAILEFVRHPRSRAEIEAHLTSISAAPIERPAVIDEALDLLGRCGAIASLPEPPVASPPARGRLVLGVTGAVASAHTPALVAMLQRAGFEVRVAMTRAARRFVSRLVLDAVTHQTSHDDLWPRDASCPAPHVHLAEWAELLLVCPASATTISRIAHGDCSDLVSAIAVTTRAPVIVAPSMNPAMLRSPQLTRNLALLLKDGLFVVRGGPGEELAQAPADRRPVPGAIPGHAAIVDIACFLADRERPDWDALYAGRDGPPPFCADRFDPDVGEALSSRGLRSGTLLDIGTGSGVLAVELQRRGFTVTGVDRAARAIELARRLAGGQLVSWRVGDVLGLDGTYQVAVDRGCLHTLDALAQREWSAAMARLIEPGGWLLVKAFSPGAQRTRGTSSFRAEQLASLLGEHFALDDSWETIFHGQGEPPARATFCVFRRQA